MLTEFAFTPSVFDEAAHDDKVLWCDQLRKLTYSMFPDTSAWPAIVSNLYSEAWHSHLDSYVAGIQDHRARKFCLEFLRLSKQALVNRPQLGEWPSEDDVAWCREALATHAVEPIDRVVSIPSTKESSIPEFSSVRCIDEVEEGGFWRNISADASPPMVIAEQVQLLRKLYVHSDWIALINPYGAGNEQAFTVALLRAAMQRDPSFGSLLFEIHLMDSQDFDPVQKTAKRQNVTADLRRKIQPHITGSNRSEVYFWPKLLDRIIVAGTYTKQSGQHLRKKARWGVSMSHVARENSAEEPPTEWKLLRPDAVTRWYNDFVSENAKNKQSPETISATS
jgi:hypothetical protein